MQIDQKIQESIKLIDQYISKYKDHIEAVKKGHMAAVEMGILSKTDDKELKSGIETDKHRIECFEIAKAALQDKLNMGNTIRATKENIDEHRRTDTEPPPVKAGLYQCPQCGTTYNRPFSICYNGCKRRLWEQ